MTVQSSGSAHVLEGLGSSEGGSLFRAEYSTEKETPALSSRSLLSAVTLANTGCSSGHPSLLPASPVGVPPGASDNSSLGPAPSTSAFHVGYEEPAQIEEHNAGTVMPSSIFNFGTAPPKKTTGFLFDKVSWGADELELIVTLGCDKTPVKVAAQARWKKQELIEAVTPHLQEGDSIQKILYGIFEVQLLDGVSLGEAGVKNKDTVHAVMDTLKLNVRLDPEAITVQVKAKKFWQKTDLVQALQLHVAADRMVSHIYHGIHKLPISGSCTLAERALQDGAELEAVTGRQLEISCVTAGGDVLATLHGTDAWTDKDVIRALNENLEQGLHCKSVVGTLAEVSPSGKVQMHAMLGAPLQLFCLFRCIPAYNLIYLLGGGLYAVSSDLYYPKVDDKSAPPLARDILVQLGARFRMIFHEAILIANPGCDVKESCLEALGIKDMGASSLTATMVQYSKSEAEARFNQVLRGVFNDDPVEFMLETLSQHFELQLHTFDSGSLVNPQPGSLLAGYAEDDNIVGLIVSSSLRQ